MSIPEEVERYANLFNGIIIQAILDAGIRPNEKEKKDQVNLLPEVISAMDYLFGRDSNIFAHHANLVGANSDQIRESLLYRDHLVNVKNANIMPDKLRILRIRHRWYQNRSFHHV
jgi:hypothetical protein